MTLMQISLSSVLLVICSGCITKREVQYVSAVKRPEEINGYMRLAQTSIQVNVIGQEQIATFTDDSVKEKRDVLITKNGKLEKITVTGISGYIVIHESDVKRMVLNTKELQKLLADPEIKALALKKGLGAVVISPNAEIVELRRIDIDDFEPVSRESRRD